MEDLGRKDAGNASLAKRRFLSTARAWKTKQSRLSAHGFQVEYSATFAQAIGSAAGANRRRLGEEYGKTIVFDYAYRHFYGDGWPGTASGSC